MKEFNHFVYMLLTLGTELKFIIVNLIEVQTCSYRFVKGYGKVPGNNYGLPLFA